MSTAYFAMLLKCFCFPWGEAIPLGSSFPSSSFPFWLSWAYHAPFWRKVSQMCPVNSLQLSILCGLSPFAEQSASVELKEMLFCLWEAPAPHRPLWGLIMGHRRWLAPSRFAGWGSHHRASWPFTFLWWGPCQHSWKSISSYTSGLEKLEIIVLVLLFWLQSSRGQSCFWTWEGSH